MQTRIILLRGVNVGGANRLPMAGFRQMLGEMGLFQPETLIQSGNAVVGSDLPDADLAAQVTQAIKARFGFAPETFVQTPATLAAALDHRFPATEGKQVHAVFLSDPAVQPDTARIATLIAPTEAYDFSPGLFRLFAPQGFGISKLAGKLTQVIPCSHTARNLNTVSTLLAMAKDRLAQP